ncbi:MAG: DUF885 domain-containing protein [Massilia sp.]
MLKTKIALAVLLTSFVLAPAGAAKPKKSSTASTSKHVGGKAKAAAKSVAKPAAKSAKAGKGKAGKAAAVAAVAAPEVAAPRPAAPAERKSDRWLDSLSMQFLNALWKIDPDTAIINGKYDGAANLVVPNAASRNQRMAFTAEWLQKFGKVDARQLSNKQRTDLALLIEKLESDRWYLTTFRDYEWNPSLYNIAQPFDLILGTEYAAKPQRLRTILRRLANVPAYYQAAQASIANPTHEHTQLAIDQAPGTMTLLADLGKEAQDSILTVQEKAIFAQRIANAGEALVGYVDFLTDLDKKQQAAGNARSFRIGKSLYEAKFAHDIQSGSTAEQTFQKALAARKELLTRMDGLADELWTKTMGTAAKPADRNKKIGMVIDSLSRTHVSRENFYGEISRQIPQLQDWVISHQLISLDPKRPLVVRETPLYQRGVTIASIDAPGPYRPQDRTFYNVTPLDGLSPEQAESTLREYNQWMLQILNIHEAIPGHYAQLVYANRSPSLVKSLFGNGAMIEGWAVYGERMMLESGYGDNTPEMWLMYCKWNLRSVTNTLLDYGVHVLGMSEAEAMDLLTRQAFQSRSQAEEKWRRVQLSSVQLTSYFSGYSEIMELREQRKQALGPKFVLRDFHDQFLSYGSAPVRVIKELMQ